MFQKFKIDFLNLFFFMKLRKEIQNVDKDGVIGQPLKLAPGGNGRVYGIVAVKNSCPKGFLSIINKFTNIHDNVRVQMNQTVNASSESTE